MSSLVITLMRELTHTRFVVAAMVEALSCRSAEATVSGTCLEKFCAHQNKNRTLDFLYLGETP